MELLIYLIFFVLLVCLGFFAGKRAESKHYKSIQERERQYQDILLFNEKTPPPTVAGQAFHLVQGSVVISSDYFKNLTSSFRNMVGGSMVAYESLLDRGRREAILRMKEQAHQHGANVIVNVLFTTASTHQNSQAGMAGVEVMAYGTAFHMPSETPTQPTLAPQHERHESISQVPAQEQIPQPKPTTNDWSTQTNEPHSAAPASDWSSSPKPPSESGGWS